MSAEATTADVKVEPTAVNVKSDLETPEKIHPEKVVPEAPEKVHPEKVKPEAPKKVQPEKVEPEAPDKKPTEDSAKTSNSEGDVKTSTEGKKPRYVRKFNKEYYEERRRAWEEAQKEKPLVEEKVKGVVKWYSVIGRYGFIERGDGKGDVFVHQSVIAKSKVEKYFLRTLDSGEEVEFDIVQGKKGLEAANVTGPEGEEVKGSKYFRVLLNGPRRTFRRRYFDGKKRERKPSKNDSKEKVEDAANDQENNADKDAKPYRKNYRRRRFQRPRKSINGEPSPAPKDGEKEASGPRRRRRGSSNVGKSPSATAGTDVSSTDVTLGGAGGDSVSLGTSQATEALIV